MPRTLLDDLAEREDTKLAMMGMEIMIIASLVGRVVDMTYYLGSLREDGGVFGQLLFPCPCTLCGVVLCRQCALRFSGAVLATATTGRIKKILDVHNLDHGCPVLNAMRVGCYRVRSTSRGLGKCRLYRGHEYETAPSYDEAEVRPNAISLAVCNNWAQSASMDTKRSNYVRYWRWLTPCSTSTEPNTASVKCAHHVGTDTS